MQYLNIFNFILILGVLKFIKSHKIYLKLNESLDFKACWIKSDYASVDYMRV